MRKLELEAIKTLVENQKTPSVSEKHIDKLSNEDFKLGWALCFAKFREVLEWIPEAKKSDLDRYAR